VTRLTVQGGQDAAGQPALALTLHVRHAGLVEALAARGSEILRRLREELGALATVAVAAGGDEERPGGLRVVAGEGVLHKTVGAFRFPVPIDAFFQVHPAQAEPLAAYVVDQIAQDLPPGVRVFDLFCGAGLFALPLLARGYAVAGAEMSRAAVRAAQRAAGAAGLPGHGFAAADLDRPQALRKLIRAHGHPQGVIVDPPRRGLSARLADDLAEAAVPLLVYVSCDPGTFARDAARLASRYALSRLRGFDFFPQTHHLELVGTFKLLR
jgi:23S rRNA (uracil1939-C5)-methyltransferase